MTLNFLVLAPHPGITFSDFTCSTQGPFGSYYCYIPCVFIAQVTQVDVRSCLPHRMPFVPGILNASHSYTHFTQLKYVFVHIQASVFSYDPTFLSHHRQKHPQMLSITFMCMSVSPKEEGDLWAVFRLSQKPSK